MALATEAVNPLASFCQTHGLSNCGCAEQSVTLQAPSMGFGLDPVQTLPGFVALLREGSEAAAADNELPIVLGGAAALPRRLKISGVNPGLV